MVFFKREGFSYEVSGPNIYFKDSIKKEMKIDMRYLYGRDVGQILNIFDFAPDTYFSRAVFTLSGVNTTTASNYGRYDWMGDKIGLPIHCWQTLANGSRSVIGEVRDYDLSGNTITWSLKSQNAVLDPSLDITFAALGAYDRYFTFPSSDFTGADLNYDVDEFGRKLLKDDNGIWSGTILRKTFKKQFVSLSSGDLIRVEGEDKFRKIKLLPSSATSKDGRPQTSIK